MKSEVSKDRDTFVEDLLANNYTTFFAATHPRHSTGNKAFRFTPTPVSPAVPYSWSYSDARERLFELSTLLTPEEAERRNINFVNPAIKNLMPAAALPTLRGGIQLLLAGERAFAHRHSANAFRLVLEAPERGAFTVVEGTEIPMTTGDLILTPNWTWHDHHNEGASHTIWYDGLDVLMAYWIGGVFYQELQKVSGETHPCQPVHQNADSLANTFGAGLLHRRVMFPDHIPVSDNTLLYYPYAAARRSLENLAQLGAGNPYDGVLLEYVNPVNGASSFPTMNTSIRLVKAKSTLEAMHRTENIIFITLQGSVTFHLPDNQKFQTQPFDVTAVPSWIPYTISNAENEHAILFSQSDRPLFQKLGFYREELA